MTSKRSGVVFFVMLLPFLLWLLIFAYAPLGGLIVAFRAFSWNAPFGGKWIGFAHFRFLFGDFFFRDAAFNTLFFVVVKAAVMVSLPAVVAFALRNAGRGMAYTYSGLTMTTYFTSWVIMSVAVRSLLSPEISRVLFGSVSLFNNSGSARWVFVASDVLKGYGWVFFIYLLAVKSLKMEYWEIAEMEGAGPWQVFWRVAIPLLAPTITVVTVLVVTGLIDSGTDQALNLAHPGIYGGTDVIGSYAYRTAIRTGHIARGAAASLLETGIRLLVVAVALLAGYRGIGRTV